MVTSDIGVDRLGIAARREGGEVVYTVPIAVYVGGSLDEEYTLARRIQASRGKRQGRGRQNGEDFGDFRKWYLFSKLLRYFLAHEPPSCISLRSIANQRFVTSDESISHLNSELRSIRGITRCQPAPHVFFDDCL